MASKPNGKCVKKTNLLVYKETDGKKSERKGPCADPAKANFKAPICHPKLKQIRICTGAEMKKMQAPKLCKCDQPKPRMRGGGRGLLGLLGFGLKAAIAAAAWYVTYDMGIWGTTDDTHELYRSYCRIVKGPACQDKSEKWEPIQCTAEKQLLKISKLDPYEYCNKPPIDLERQTYDLQNHWNQAVFLIFSGIAGFPHNLVNAFSGNETKKVIDEEGKEEKCVLYNDLPEEERELLLKNAYKK